MQSKKKKKAQVAVRLSPLDTLLPVQLLVVEWKRPNITGFNTEDANDQTLKLTMYNEKMLFSSLFFSIVIMIVLPLAHR